MSNSMYLSLDASCAFNDDLFSNFGSAMATDILLADWRVMSFFETCWLCCLLCDAY